jgi:mRNA interferase RelE/StbE
MWVKGRDSYRIRVGNYRVVYDIFDTRLIVDVITPGHRKDVYD